MAFSKLKPHLRKIGARTFHSEPSGHKSNRQEFLSKPFDLDGRNIRVPVKPTTFFGSSSNQPRSAILLRYKALDGTEVGAQHAYDCGQTMKTVPPLFIDKLTHFLATETQVIKPVDPVKETRPPQFSRNLPAKDFDCGGNRACGRC